MTTITAPGRGQRPHRRRGAPRGATYRPNLEALEDRALPSFYAPVGYATGATPNAVVTADFNSDGRLDVAVANYGSSNTVSRSFVVTVQPVNDAPTLSQPVDLTLNEDDPTQTLDLTGISAGPLNEAGQRIQQLRTTLSGEQAKSARLSQEFDQQAASVSTLIR